MDIDPESAVVAPTPQPLYPPLAGLTDRAMRVIIDPATGHLPLPYWGITHETTPPSPPPSQYEQQQAYNQIQLLLDSVSPNAPFDTPPSELNIYNARLSEVRAFLGQLRSGQLSSHILRLLLTNLYDYLQYARFAQTTLEIQNQISQMINVLNYLAAQGGLRYNGQTSLWIQL